MTHEADIHSIARVMVAKPGQCAAWARFRPSRLARRSRGEQDLQNRTRPRGVNTAAKTPTRPSVERCDATFPMTSRENTRAGSPTRLGAGGGPGRVGLEANHAWRVSVWHAGSSVEIGSLDLESLLLSTEDAGSAVVVRPRVQGGNAARLLAPANGCSD